MIKKIIKKTKNFYLKKNIKTEGKLINDENSPISINEICQPHLL